MTTNYFSPHSFVAVFGSEIRDPGWVKIRSGVNIPISNTGLTLYYVPGLEVCLTIAVYCG
jgi:hypothetical protein